MAEKQAAEAATETIDQLLEELAAIVTTVEQDQDHEMARTRLQRWKVRTVSNLQTVFGAEEAAKFDKETTIRVTHFHDRVGDRIREAEGYKKRLIALREELEAHPEFVLSQPGHSPRAASQELAGLTNPSCVFLIHGHDEANLLKLRDQLKDRWGLDPKILSSEPWAGRTLIEKFEEEAQEAAFAVALITPDDVIVSDDGEYLQGRPNVIFELGWFCGKLGRKQVTILLKHGTQLHSDLDGVGRIPFSDSIEEAIVDLEKELKAAGLI